MNSTCIQIDYEIPQPATQEQCILNDNYVRQKFLETIEKLSVDGVQFNRIDFVPINIKV